MSHSLDLSKAAPTPCLLPAMSLAYSSYQVLTHPYTYAGALLVGESSELRAAISGWLGGYYAPDGGAIDEARVAVTAGVAESTLAAILGRFTDPVYTRAVWVVVPAEVEWLKGIAGDAGLDRKLRTLPEGSNGEGIDVEMFESGLREEEYWAHSARGAGPIFKEGDRYPKIYKSILYLQPTFKNPTGSTIPLPIRKRLVELAREYDVLIVAEEDFDFLRWGEGGVESPIPRLCDIDRVTMNEPGGFGNAISCGSFSRVIAPGCRVGWIEGSSRFVKEFGKTGSDHGRNSTTASKLMEAIIRNLLSTGILQSHLSEVLIPVYQKRHSTVVSAVATSLAPLGVNLITDTSRTSGGWFLWMQLPNYCDASFLKCLEKDYNVILACGSEFGVGLEDFVRICFAWESEEALAEALGRISKCLGDFRAKTPVSGSG
ncbi:PLP-dependent transferase [Tuber magnatum]|uniref:PLP-dependent transferase n=1 Tax=Tuber magnatum TaxID=42249 RepID=A0A317SFM9_9PEZI|nr:PLP-dependent transferase [Tuber magnatum]